MNPNKANISISKKSFLTAVILLAVLMLMAFSLTYIMGGRSYSYDQTTGEYEFANKGINGLPVWKLFLAPIMVMLPGSDGFMTIILIMALLIIIGGVFNSLEKSGILTYMLQKTVNKYKNKRYFLLAALTFFFMALGSGVGMFEEAVPLVPIVILLCYSMGWDSLTGLGASLLAVCCGFAAGVINPFTVGVAQSLGGLPMFSGILIRILVFVVIYGILISFLLVYAKKIEKNPQKSSVYKEDSEAKKKIGEEKEFVQNKAMDRSLYWFLAWMGAMVLSVILSIPVRALSDYVMIIIVVCYIFAGIGASIISGKGKKIIGNFAGGVVAILPAIFMILMAASVKYILYEADIMYTILFYAVKAIERAPSEIAVLLIYLVVLVFNFVIPSGSAKAALLMPTIYPLADMLGIHRQTAVLAFTFGDGFSNVLYPTNPVLLITLGLTVVSFAKWFKWSIKIQLVFLVATALILLFVHNVIYVV